MKEYILADIFLLILMFNSVSAQVNQTKSISSQPIKRVPTVKEWISLKSPDTPSISPDGRFVVYTIQESNWESNSFESEIWMTTIATGERRRLTDAKGSSRRPNWSPDGNRLAFISNREGSSQIYIISPPNAEVVKLTQIASGVNAFQWSPDSRHIAFASSETLTKGGETAR